MDIDDLTNPEYRKGRRDQRRRNGSEALRPSPLTDMARRARFAAQTARAEFGRFYWNGDLARQLQRNLEESLRRKLEQAAEARRRERNSRRR